ncbi:hypothetical protein D6T64_10045 [Cryobacterium melibiosiphilum]|uniref:SRPBCC family protein n=1 Tax=Cryobacterium melibiosiphilum TaxID=995039 RepID=A0A3A5MGC6_9MICO|nr:SRPBCC family protein [Cryobacterium melibiosiphilum]RJT88472.1 hypothetical protein D6T64_10045 [Cryobacterium melibiosiphilum]
MEYVGRRIVNASSATIVGILADIRRLPEWNTAILSVTTGDAQAIALKTYPIRAKLPGACTMTYDTVSTSHIGWRVDGFHAHETGKWTLVQVADNVTEVTHTIRHSGAVFRLLAGAFRTVPGLRLDRLQRRAEGGK